MYKVLFALVAAILIATVAVRSAFDATVSAQRQHTQPPWAQNQMEFIAWNNEKWRAWIRGDSFEQLPQNTHRWTRHANPSLAYIDWQGQSWQAKIDGGHFCSPTVETGMDQSCGRMLFDTAIGRVEIPCVRSIS